MYLIAMGAGLLVGVIYGLLGVRSPAPPAIALVGLLGILLGEQIVPIARRLVDGTPLTKAWFVSECRPRITGVPPASPGNATASSEQA